MGSMFQQAMRKKLKLRMAIDGPSGCGKTYTGLRFSFALLPPGARSKSASGRPVAVLCTEHQAAAKYQGLAPDGVRWDFDVCELTHFAPTTYTAAIHEAARLGYHVLLIDSLSHAWTGTGGALELVDKSKSTNSFTAWKDVTPMHQEMIDTILVAPLHVIATMRSKMDYVLEEEDRNGRKVQVPKKVGMAPIQRQGMEYEFDIVADMDLSHTLVVGKTRCPAVDGRRMVKPDGSFMAPVVAWLDEGTDAMPSGFTAPPVSLPPAPVDKAAATSAEPPFTPDSPRQGKPMKPASGKAPAATAATQDLRGKCSESQRNEIIELAKAIGMDASDLKAAVVKRGVEKVADLSGQQADELIAKLRAKKVHREANDRF